jgi:predicted PurR-regulated permease PerM
MMRETDFTDVLGVRIALGLFLAGLLYLGWQVLHNFLSPVAWAAILVYLAWPVHLRVRRLAGGRAGLGALASTVLLGLLFALPLLWVLGMLGAEVPSAHRTVVQLLSQGSDALPPQVARLPWIGPELERLLDMSAEDPAALRAQIVDWLKPWAEGSLQLAGDIGVNTAKMALVLMTAFFFFRDGESLLAQFRAFLLGLLGSRAQGYLHAVGDTTKAVLYGLILTALLQGALAGLGYWAAGVQAPVLLGALTAVLALLPFGTPLIWGPASLWLYLDGQTWQALGLFAWGLVAVSQVDNLLRPLLIGGAARIPYILVLFGVIGGLSAFGLAGLFVGPIVVAVLLAVWREWIAEQPRAGGQKGQISADTAESVHTPQEPRP